MNYSINQNPEWMLFEIEFRRFEILSSDVKTFISVSEE